MLSHATLRKRFKSACKKLAAPKELCEYRTAGTGFGDPHVEMNNGCYEYVVTERGKEFERRRTQDPDELIYWLLEGVVYRMASDHELKNRIEGQDHRRLLFEKQVELFGIVNPAWAAKKQAKLYATLKEHPFNDRGA